MPRIMTMNGDHQRVATAPLDLRTTNRERGTPDCNGRVRDARATGGSPAPSAYTGTESLERHCTAVRGALSGSESVASRKRPADKSSLRLPLRKRPVPVEPETERQSVEPEIERAPIRPLSRDRFLPAYSTFRDSFGGQAADENRVGPASGTPRRNEVVGHGPGGYPIPFLYPVDYVPLYFFSGLHPVNCLPPVQELNHTVTQLAENSTADIALATHQDEDGDTALHIAVVQGELAIVDKLIQLFLLAHRSLDIYNNLRQTPLHLAVITEQANLVKALLTAGADPTVLDRNGQTAVHLCCEYNQCDCLSVVLSHSSSSTCLETRNYEGFSPLHLAVLRGHKDLAKMLLDAGGDINAMDIKSGQSPLMHVVESNNADMVHFLIESGCDVNSQSYSGNTALHSACGRGQVDTVRLLLKSGADISLKNYHNDTPVMVAKNKKITDVLRGRGSNQMRVQDQQCVSVSSHETNLTENGSPSPNHSRGSSPSPSTTLHNFHHNSSHSLVFPFF